MRGSFGAGAGVAVGAAIGADVGAGVGVGVGAGGSTAAGGVIDGVVIGAVASGGGMALLLASSTSCLEPPRALLAPIDAVHSEGYVLE